MHGVTLYQTSEPWLPLDKKWIAEIRIAGKRYASYGATREEAEDNLMRKVAKLGVALE